MCSHIVVIQSSQLQKGCNILVTTPGRFKQYLTLCNAIFNIGLFVHSWLICK